MQSLTLLIVLFAITFFGCNKEANEISLRTGEQPAPVLKVEVSEQQLNIKVNETVALQVFFEVHNYCGEFGSFGTTTQGQALTITVYPHYRTDIMCAQAFNTLQTTYTFKTETPGTFTLNFWAGENNYITKIIRVSR
ncbi:hypothetical protein ACXYMU_13270 [Pontibacter sp. CAU 1760]